MALIEERNKLRKRKDMEGYRRIKIKSQKKAERKKKNGPKK